MCGRFTALTWDEVERVIREMEFQSPIIAEPDWPARHVTPEHDAFPGATAPVILHGEDGLLRSAELNWGFDLGTSLGLAFNTRLETASSSDFWRDSFENRRCIVPALRFYEPHATEMAQSPETGRRIKQQYAFQSAHPDASNPHVLLMAGIWAGDRFSIMTTKPNAVVSPIHDRMPLLLTSENACNWLRFQPAVPQRIELRSKPLYSAAPGQTQLSFK